MELLLTPLQFGVPNSRLRYYLLAKFKTIGFDNARTSQLVVWKHIPGHGEDWLDPRHVSHESDDLIVKELRDYLDGDGGDEFSIPDRVLEKWGRLFDIVLPSQKRTCCFTRGQGSFPLLSHALPDIFPGYTKLAERAGSVLQLNEELDVRALSRDYEY